MTNLLKNKKQSYIDKESVLAMVSHDLKNPVNAGIMAVKLLENSNLSPLNSYQEELIENIYGSLKYMKNLIENILDRYKLTNNVYRLERISVDFVDFVSKIIEESKYIFTSKKQIIKLDINVQNKIINIDLLEIKRVINNLMSNASIYAPENSKIIISIYEDIVGNVCFSIQNKSKGLNNPKDVFEKFYSNNQPLQSFACGLGLYIAKEIIAAHKGKIFMENIINNFIKVTFILPRK